MNKPATFWMVAGTGPSHHRHETRFSAEVEAKRLAAKMANNLSASNAIHKTYVPVDLDTVRQVDVARQKGRAK